MSIKKKGVRQIHRAFKQIAFRFNWRYLLNMQQQLNNASSISCLNITIQLEFSWTTSKIVLSFLLSLILYSANQHGNRAGDSMPKGIVLKSQGIENTVYGYLLLLARVYCDSPIYTYLWLLRRTNINIPEYPSHTSRAQLEIQHSPISVFQYPLSSILLRQIYFLVERLTSQG